MTTSFGAPRAIDSPAAPAIDPHAGGGTRTPKGVSPPAPKTGASAISPRPRVGSRFYEEPALPGPKPPPRPETALPGPKPPSPARNRDTTSISIGIVRADARGAAHSSGLHRHPPQPRQDGVQGDQSDRGADPAGLRRADPDCDAGRLEQARGPEAAELRLVPSLPGDRGLRGPVGPGSAADCRSARDPAVDHRGAGSPTRRASLAGADSAPARSA